MESIEDCLVLRQNLESMRFFISEKSSRKCGSKGENIKKITRLVF